MRIQPLKPITIDLKGAADRFISNLGYVKAQARRLTQEGFLLGETSIGDESPYADWTSDQWERLAITSGWVYSDTKLIGQEVSQGIFEVQERDDEASESYSQVEAHPFEGIIEGSPNPDMSQAFTWLYIVQWLLLRGESYWMLVPNKKGDLVQMWPLPANRVRPLPDVPGSDRLFGGFRYQAKRNEEPYILPPENVCYHRLPNPWDYRRGMSPITAYRLALQSDDQAKQLGLSNLDNGLTLRALVSVRSDISDVEFERARDEIRRGQQRGDRYLVTPAGEIDVKALSIPQKDAEFLTSREFTRDEFDRVYGIPGGFWAKDANRANIQGAIEIFRTFTIWPLMELLAEDITTQVIHRYYEPDLRGRFRDIRPVNKELLIKEEEHQRKAMTYDEVRAMRGDPPHPISEVGMAPFPAAGEVYKRIMQQAGLAEQLTHQPQQSNGTPPDEPDDGETDDEPEMDEEDQKAALQDLKRWRSVAVRLIKRSKDPAIYDFESDHISNQEAAWIKAQLQQASTVDQVKQIFAASSTAKQNGDVVTAVDEAIIEPGEVGEYQEAIAELIDRAQAGQIDQGSFEQELAELVTASLLAIFLLGLGLDSEDQMAPDERAAFDEQLRLALDAVPQLAGDVYAGRFAEDADDPLDLESRLGLWSGFAAGLFMFAFLRPRRDDNEFLQWNYSPFKDHCEDCLRLNGQVHTRREWRESGFHPKGLSLACTGRHCGCFYTRAQGPAVGTF